MLAEHSTGNSTPTNFA